VYFNTFATGTESLDLTESEEFASLVQSASDLGMKLDLPVRYGSRNVVVNGIRLHLLEWGDPAAPPVLLLHGGNQTAHSWDLVSLNLAKHYHVVAAAQRGHGDSEWPRDGDTSHQTMAQDALALIDTLGFEKPAVIAHSMGGIVAMNLLTRSDVASRLVIVDISPEPPSPGDGRNRIQEFVRSAREFDSVDDYVDRVSAYEPYRKREHILRTMRYNLMQRQDGKLVSKQYPRVMRPPEGADVRAFRGVALEDMGLIKCPVLVLRGADSNILSPGAAERFVNTLADGRLVTVPNCAHNVHTQNTAGFLAAVLPFLAQ
jgi:pimeloyl-ACP methyl ester carboxylesterase